MVARFLYLFNRKNAFVRKAQKGERIFYIGTLGILLTLPPCVV